MLTSSNLTGQEQVWTNCDIGIGRARVRKTRTFCLVKNNKKTLDLQIFSRIGKTMEFTANSKYYRKHRHTCKILIMFTYLMMSKLIFYPCIVTYLITWSPLEQVRSVFRTPPNICDGTFCKNN